jgi:hypothetical protein
MKIKFSLSLNISRAAKATPDQEHRDVDVAGTQTERLSEYDELGVEDRRIGFQVRK